MQEKDPKKSARFQELAKQNPGWTTEQIVAQVEREFAPEVPGGIPGAGGRGGPPGAGRQSALLAADVAAKSGPGMTVGEIARTVGHGLAFSLPDNVMRLFGANEAADRWNSEMARIRGEHQGEAMAMELLSGFALPGVGFAKGVVPLLGRVAPAAAAVLSRAPVTRAMIGGAVAGGASTFGETDEMEPLPRAFATLLGSTVGGLVGGAAREVPAFLHGARRMSGDPGGRVADDLRRVLNVSTSYDEALQAAEAGIRRVSTDMYQPLEQALPEITDPALRRFLGRKGMRKTVGKALGPEQAERAAQLTNRASFTAGPAGTITGAAGPGPSFLEIQQIRQYMRDQIKDAAAKGERASVPLLEKQLDDLDAILGSNVDIRAADAAYYHAYRVKDALAEGRKIAGKPMAELDRVLRETGSNGPDAVQALRRGMAEGWLHNFEGGGNDFIRKVDGRHGYQKRLRRLFDDDATYAKFMDDLQLQRRAADVRMVIQRYVLWGGAAAGTGYLIARTGG
jgi:hypothetical protein